MEGERPGVQIEPRWNAVQVGQVEARPCVWALASEQSLSSSLALEVGRLAVEADDHGPLAG